MKITKNTKIYIGLYILKKNTTKMKQYIKINLTSPQNILEWTERLLPTGKLVGEITKSL
jgi:hypothetical protein